MAKRGRPSTYTPAIAAEICARLAGGESLRTICSSTELPATSNVFEWLKVHPDFRDQYASARAAGVDAMVEETLAIADNIEEDANSRRVRIDARKWFASKMRPEKYGDRTALELGGPGGAELKVTIRSVLDDNPK